MQLLDGPVLLGWHHPPWDHDDHSPVVVVGVEASPPRGMCLLLMLERERERENSCNHC